MGLSSPADSCSRVSAFSRGGAGLDSWSVKAALRKPCTKVCAVNCNKAHACNESVSSDVDLKHLVAGPAPPSRRSCGRASLTLGYPGCTLGRDEVSM